MAVVAHGHGPRTTATIAGTRAVAVVAIALGVALGLAVHLINRVAADEVQLAARSLFGIADLSVQGSGAGSR